MATPTEHKVVVSAAVLPEQRDELVRRAIEGDRTLSQAIRKALRGYLGRDEQPHEETR